MVDNHKRATLGDLCQFISGNGFRPSDWKSSGLPIIRIQNLNGSQSFNYFDGEPEDRWIVEPGDLLFAWAGVKGVSFGPKIWPGPKGVLNQHIYRVVVDPRVDQYWMYLALQMATRRIESRAHGFKSSLVHVHKNDIANQVIDLPPLPEQRKIAEILRLWDEAIEKLEALRAAKQKRLDGLTHALIFGKLGMNGQRRNRQLRRLSEVTFELTMRNTNLAVGYAAVMGVTKARGIVPMREQTIGGDLSRYKRLPPRAFAYNPMRINVGSIAMNDRDEEVLVSPDYVVFGCTEHGLAPDFLNHLRKTHWWSHHINIGGSGSVRMRTYYDDLAAMKLPLPTYEEQLEIVAVLNVAQEDVKATEKASKVLTCQKRGLMQKLLTGEWRVNTTDFCHPGLRGKK